MNAVPTTLDLRVREWLNTTAANRAPVLEGKVVMVEAFQLLCPGCVSHALPQAQRVHEHFSGEDFVLVGLHTVFEHHSAQGRTDVLQAFAHENRLTFPIAVDDPAETGNIPHTMHAYGLQGTPSTLLFARNGRLVFTHFGVVGDLVLGSTIANLLAGPIAGPAQNP